MLPELKHNSIIVKSMGGIKLEVREMSARCYADVIDSRASGKNDFEIAAIVCRQCVPDWRDNEVDEILDSVSPEILIEVSNAITRFSGVEPGESEADQPDASS